MEEEDRREEGRKRSSMMVPREEKGMGTPRRREREGTWRGELEEGGDEREKREEKEEWDEGGDQVDLSHSGRQGAGVEAQGGRVGEQTGV